MSVLEVVFTVIKEAVPWRPHLDQRLAILELFCIFV